MDREDLKYKFLNRFDNSIIHAVASVSGFQSLPIEKLWDKDDDQVLAFRRGDLLFVFNWNPVKSFSDYGLLAPQGEYATVIDSDAAVFGGFGNNDGSVRHFTSPDPLYAPYGKGWLRLYLPARSAQVLRLVHGRAAGCHAPSQHMHRCSDFTFCPFDSHSIKGNY